ncbi:DUF484 family protein [Undibacterium sp. LFS511W]|jgi:hypothetical protein|uniref:DUF484 family protein n=2 Tax=Undibacterium luofuense TaxID=2828733 RepID=A0A941DJL4_9BURK|nr:DUF484 family protein [Undibacterium luofuense]MBR7782207.1 DUF484 family protein [Undibacterium luofuense]
MNSSEIVTYLLDNPQFFEEHAELLSTVRLTSPVMGKAISLQERQMEVVRDKYRTLELKLSDLMRNAESNLDISQKFQRWTRELLQTRNDIDLPHVLTQSMKDIFGLPHATLRVWNVTPEFAHGWFAEAVSDDARLFAKGLNAPFCGPNQDFEAARWLEGDTPVASVAMLPLRSAAGAPVFGLLVLGSDDASRYTKDMATDFLVQIADTAAAALHFLTQH